LSAPGTFARDPPHCPNVIPLPLPPLRERAEDVDALIAHFCARFRPDRPVTLEPASRAYLERHRWPGNVRELEHVIERALLLAPGEVIRLAEVAIEQDLLP